MFKSSNFIVEPTDTDLNLKIKDEFNHIVHILKASKICRFHRENDTIVINSYDSTDAIYLKFYNSTDALAGINRLYEVWIILKTNYTA